MKDLLLQYGFVFHSKCSCSGTYAEKYIKNDALVEIKPHRKVWSLKINRVFTERGTSENLIQKLLQYGIIQEIN